MSEDVGSIYIEIELEVRRLLDGVDQVNRRLNSLPGAANNASSSLNRAERSADTLNTGLSKLASTIKVLIAASTLKEMANMVQKYQEMSERVQMATSSQAEFNDVQARLLKTANGTFRALSEAQELYITTASSLRSMGYTTSQAIDIQDSMSYAFVKNATSADKASTAISAFSKAINTGKVGADQWETLTSAIPSVIDDIAAASGKSAAAIRSLGAAGKITASQLSEGLRQSLDENTKSATGMQNTLTDATVRLKTSITAILVSIEQETGALKTFTEGLIAAADSMLEFNSDSEGMKSVIDAGAKALGVFAVVMGARYAGALATATKEKVKGAIAARDLALAERTASRATADRTIADLRAATVAKERALDEIRLAEMMKLTAYNVGSAAAAEQRLSAARIAATSAVDNYNRALAVNNAAQAGIARGAGLISRALGFVGGPVGAAILAASAVMYFSQKSDEARSSANELADSVNALTDKFKQMSHTEIASSIAKMRNELPELKDQVDEAQEAFNKSTAAVKRQEREIERYGTVVTRGRQAAEALPKLLDDQAIAAGNLEVAQKRLSQVQSAIGIGQSQLNGTRREGIDLLRRENTETGIAAGMIRQLGNAMDFTTKKKEEFNSTSLMIERPAGVQSYLDSQLDQIELQSELNDKKRAQLKAEQEIRALVKNSGVKVTDEDTESYVRTARERAGAEFDATKAIQNRKKSDQEANSESKKSVSNAETVAEKLASLKRQSEQAAESTTELSRAQAIQRAGESLGKSASPEEIKNAEMYAAAIWDRANAFKGLAVAESLLPEKQENTRYTQETKDLKNALDAQKITRDEFNQASEQAERQHQTNLAKIRSESVVSPTQEAAGLVDPVQQLANENARKLALIQQFEADKTITEQQALALRNAANQQYEQQRLAAQWEIWRQQSTGNEVAAAAFDSFAGNASNAFTGILTGSMSASDAMRSLGSTVLNSVINTFVQMGVEQARAAIMGASVQQTAIAATTAAQIGGVAATTAASTTAAGTTLAAWLPAALVASVGSFGAAAIMGGAALVGAFALTKALGRKNGGPVSAGNLYEFGEGNLPEMLQMGGKNYMLPGNNGRVFSNKDVNGKPTIPKASTGLERMQQEASASSNSSSSNNASAVVNIVIENNGTPQQIVSQSTEKGLTGQDVIRIITQDANEKGPILQSIMANTSATPRLR
ncbi:tape measure protein [Escherichia coli]